MDVTFKRTGERRYGVFVDRANAPELMMHPAPGWDPYLPHDLLHFVAEAEWRIERGIFGQLAAGGNAGTFWFVEQKVPNKWKHRGERLYNARGDDMSRSEQVAGRLHAAWRAHRWPRERATRGGTAREPAQRCAAHAAHATRAGARARA